MAKRSTSAKSAPKRRTTSRSTQPRTQQRRAAASPRAQRKTSSASSASITEAQVEKATAAVWPHGTEKPQGLIDTILSERGKRYGHFRDHARLAVKLRSNVREFVNFEEYPRPHGGGFTKQQPFHLLRADAQQSIDTILDKIARILNGDPNYLDNWDDIQGYAKLISDRIRSEAAFLDEIDTTIDRAQAFRHIEYIDEILARLYNLRSRVQFGDPYSVEQLYVAQEQIGNLTAGQRPRKPKKSKPHTLENYTQIFRKTMNITRTKARTKKT